MTGFFQNFLPVPLLRRHCAVFAAALALLSGGCGDARKQALDQLDKRGLKAEPETLFNAAAKGDGALIPLLQSAGVRAPVPAAHEPTVLHAAEEKFPDLIPSLIPLCDPAVINHPGPGGRGILEMVLEAQRPDLATLLLDAGALPESAASGPAALVRLAGPQPALAERLIGLIPERHVDLTALLLEAVPAGDLPRISLLLQRGADTGAKRSADGASALDLASADGFHDAVKSLLNAGAKAVESPEALRHAVRRGDLALVETLLNAGSSPESADAGPEQMPVRLAVTARRLEIAEAMFKRGAKAVPFAAAAVAAGDQELLALLFRYGVSPQGPGPDGNTPLHAAAITGRADLIPLLLEMGADRSALGAMGQTPFIMAAVARQEGTMRALVTAGENPDQPFRKPYPPELVPMLDSEHFVKWLQKDEGLNPLMLAAARGDDDQVRLLLELGAKRGAQTKSWHRYPIRFACDTENLTAAQLLLGRDPKINPIRNKGVISLSKQRVQVFRDGELIRTSRISTGKKSTPTPTGRFVITDKQTHWVSSIYEVPMPFFMRLSCRDIGLHQGVVPGYPASHGCIRVPKGDIQVLFRTFKIGDPVIIEP